MSLDWAKDRQITHRSFRIVELVGNEDLITGRIFEDCTIYGPAVLAPLDRMVFESTTFEGDPEGLFWEIPENRTHVIGAIGLVDCTFRRCIFRRIGFAGKPASIEQFRKAIQH